MIRAATALSAGQWATRAAIAVMPVAALLCAAGAGATTPPWLVGVVTLVSLGWAAFPESAAGATVVAVVVVTWGVQLGSRVDPLVLPACAALLVAHIAAVLASYGPATMPLDPAVVRLWVRRGALVCLPVPALYLVAARAQDVSAPSGWWLAGLAATFSAIAVASVTLSVHREDDPTAGRAVTASGAAGHIGI